MSQSDGPANAGTTNTIQPKSKAVATQASSCLQLIQMLSTLLPPTIIQELGPKCCKWSSGSLGAPTILQRLLSNSPLPPGIWVSCDGPNLTEIYIDGHSNYTLQGTLSEAGFPGNLTHLRLIALHNHKQLTGSVPDLSSLDQLQYIDLHGNSHVGLLPSGLSNGATLRHIDFSNTMISGDIPWDIPVTFPTLSYLNLSNTYVFDLVPDLSRMPGLTTCDLESLYMCAPNTLAKDAICTKGVRICQDSDLKGIANGANSPSKESKGGGTPFSNIAIAGLLVACISILSVFIFITIRVTYYRKERRSAQQNRGGEKSSPFGQLSRRGLAGTDDLVHTGQSENLHNTMRSKTGSSLDYTDALNRMRLLPHNSSRSTLSGMPDDQTSSTHTPQFVVLHRTDTTATLSSFNSVPCIDEQPSNFTDEDRICMRLHRLGNRVLNDPLSLSQINRRSLEMTGTLYNSSSRSFYEDQRSLALNSYILNKTGDGTQATANSSALRLLSQPLTDLASDPKTLRSYLKALLSTAQQRNLDILLRDMCLDRIETCLGDDSVMLVRRDESKEGTGYDDVSSFGSGFHGKIISWQPKLLLEDGRLNDT
ncbi:hypothetical protein BDV3_002930 [Batrachochytrium dendrobatidis]